MTISWNLANVRIVITLKHGRRAEKVYIIAVVAIATIWYATDVLVLMDTVHYAKFMEMKIACIVLKKNRRWMQPIDFCYRMYIHTSTHEAAYR